MAAVVIIGTALLSHRVLRPIRTLTVASRRVGQGDLAGRVPVQGNDELAGLARSFNRMADSLQRGEERQRRLVADVAHELRTPLANLRGYLEALKDGVIEPDPDLFASLHEEAVLQQRIVDDLQDLAQAEAGNLAYHRVAVDLAELLETCRTAHRAVAETEHVSLTVEAEAVRVYADPDRLRQVIGNLITNALRATAAGGSVTRSASVRRSPSPCRPPGRPDPCYARPAVPVVVEVVGAGRRRGTQSRTAKHCRPETKTAPGRQWREESRKGPRVDQLASGVLACTPAWAAGMLPRRPAW